MKRPCPRKPRFGLTVRRSPSGLGLYAAEDIPKGRFVVEYWGRVVSDEEAQKVAGRYLFDLGSGRTILGAARANVARYANHACRPNCEARQVGHRIFLWSIKGIRAGDPITFDYGREYFNAFIRPGGCRCARCLMTAAKR